MGVGPHPAPEEGGIEGLPSGLSDLFRPSETAGCAAVKAGVVPQPYLFTESPSTSTVGVCAHTYARPCAVRSGV